MVSETSATVNPAMLVAFLAAVVAVLGLFATVLLLVIRRQVEDSLHRASIEHYEVMSRRSDETFNRVLERERATDLREREIIVDLRTIVDEFREILNALSLLKPEGFEGWDEARATLDRRLDRVDARLDQKTQALSAA